MTTEFKIALLVWLAGVFCGATLFRAIDVIYYGF